MYTPDISRYNAALHITQQLWLWSDFELAKDIQQLKDEQWGVSRELLEEMWPRDIENELRKPLG